MESFTDANYPSSNSLPIISSIPFSQSPIQEYSIPHALIPQAQRDQLSTPEYPAEVPKLRSEVPLQPSATILATHSHSATNLSETRSDDESLFYRCSLCQKRFSSNNKPFHLPRSLSYSTRSERYTRSSNEGCGRTVCKDCWIWVYNIAICWTCGEIVVRDEERVGFGWCWWHWACLGCLLCKVRSF